MRARRRVVGPMWCEVRVQGHLDDADEPDDPRAEEPDYAILEEVDGRWLVDEIHEDPAPAAATPAT